MIAFHVSAAQSTAKVSSTSQVKHDDDTLLISCTFPGVRQFLILFWWCQWLHPTRVQIWAVFSGDSMTQRWTVELVLPKCGSGNHSKQAQYFLTLIRIYDSMAWYGDKTCKARIQQDEMALDLPDRQREGSQRGESFGDWERGRSGFEVMYSLYNRPAAC